MTPWWWLDYLLLGGVFIALALLLAPRAATLAPRKLEWSRNPLEYVDAVIWFVVWFVGNVAMAYAGIQIIFALIEFYLLGESLDAGFKAHWMWKVLALWPSVGQFNFQVAPDKIKKDGGKLLGNLLLTVVVDLGSTTVGIYSVLVGAEPTALVTAGQALAEPAAFNNLWLWGFSLAGAIVVSILAQHNFTVRAFDLVGIELPPMFDLPDWMTGATRGRRADDPVVERA